MSDALKRVTDALANAEDRLGQQEMAELVANAIAAKRHLVVQAGTGTGKTLAYLVPAIEADARVVVATATKALQDQLATKDLPFLAEHVGRDFDWAVLKGRSNYVCLQRLREMSAGAEGQLELETMALTTKVEIKRLAEWSGTTSTGDMAELDWTPSDNAWRAVSVGSDECPGADRCPLGDPCFAEQARRRAAAADVIVVNTHLYGLNVASGGAILPDHDVVVFDEAHVLEDIMSDTVGVEIAPGRFTALSGIVRRILDDPKLIGSIAEIAEGLRDVLTPHVGNRLPTPLPDSVQEVLTDARLRLGRANETLVAIDTKNEDAKQRRLRAQTMTGRAIEQLDIAIEGREGYVAFVSGSRDAPRLEVAPLDVGPAMTDGVWSQRTAILTSATIPSSLANRVGIAADSVDVADVGSPFDYEHHSMLYCAMHLPNPELRWIPSGRPRRVGGADHCSRRSNAGAVHQLAFDGRSRRGAARADRPADPHPTRPPEAGTDQGVRGQRRDVPLRDGWIVPGRRRARPDAVARGDRPHPVPPPGRSAPERTPGTIGADGILRDRHSARIDDARAGVRTIDPLGDRQGRRRRDGPASRHGPLPLGHHQGVATDAAHEGPRRRRDLPPRNHIWGLTPGVTLR